MFVMHSEAVNKLNVALKYCDQLKNNLHASILHVQMLNRKYNTKDYYLSLSMPICDSTRRSQSMMQQNITRQSKSQVSTRLQQIRPIKDIKRDFNHFIVDGIKLRREVETAATQLKLLQNDHKVESPYIIKKQMQPLKNISASPSSGCKHGRSFGDSSLESMYIFEQKRIAAILRSRRSLDAMTVQHRLTPPPQPRKRTRETFHNQLVISAQAKANTQSPVNVKKFRFQSTPIRINEPSTSSSIVNRSSSLNISAINSGFSQIIDDDNDADDDDDDDEYGSRSVSTMHSSINPDFSIASNSNLSVVQSDSSKRICWTRTVKVKRYSISQRMNVRSAVC